jgi:hypothetical protein
MAQWDACICGWAIGMFGSSEGDKSFPHPFVVGKKLLDLTDRQAGVLFLNTAADLIAAIRSGRFEDIASNPNALEVSKLEAKVAAQRIRDMAMQEQLVQEVRHCEGELVNA